MLTKLPKITSIFGLILLSGSLRAAATQSWIERFDAPLTGWTKGNVKDGKTDYFLVVEGGNSFLRSAFIPGTEGKPIQKKMAWNTKVMPFLQWKWRVNKFPTGAKLNVEDKSDAPMQIYVIWKDAGRRFSLKYAWADSDPVGFRFQTGSFLLGKMETLVIRSGGKTGEWHSEKRNLKEDFKKAFQMDMPEETEGLALLSDGDGTKTEPSADIDDIEALSE